MTLISLVPGLALPRLISIVSQLLLISASALSPSWATGQEIHEAEGECRIVEPVKMADEAKFPWELMKEARFRKAYFALLGSEHQKERWLSLGGQRRVANW